jgi:hypothetical protein
MKNTLLVIIASLILASCTWVKLSPEGEKISIRTLDQVSDCIKIGKTRAMLKDKIAGVHRNKEKVQKELETLARNTAATMDADTIVPASEIENGEQEFTVFKCSK